MRETRTFNIVVTDRLWFNEAIKGWVKVFQFPPGRKPKVGKLKKGDICVIYLSDAKSFVGEFNVSEVKLVNREEFSQFEQLAYEVPKAPFPRGEQKSWIILFDEIKPYPREVMKSEVPKISEWPLLGFSHLTQKHWDVLEKIRELAKIEQRPVRTEHDELLDLICELGSMLRYDTVDRKRYLEGFEYDVLWWKRPRKMPTHVFEVQIKGELLKALSKLKHAKDVWGSKLFLVAYEKDLEKARELISGAFHELENSIILLSPEQVRDYYAYKKRFLKLQTELETMP